jgi:hydrogenase expression/formation protein HypD
MHYTFVAVGFETTTPLIAASIERAAAQNLDNFTVLTAHKRVPPALKALADDPHVKLDALLLPGHVSTILGLEPYQFLAREYGIPGVIAGFEPVDMLQAIAELLEQLLTGQPKIQNAYTRAVMSQGNPHARAVIERVFEGTDAQWRGLGRIPDSGYQLRSTYKKFDADARFNITPEPTVEPKGCRCGDVLRGYLAPNECPLYAKACTPANPIGPCMVSSEGSCAAFYKYQL